MNKMHLGTWMGVPLYVHWSILIFYAVLIPTFSFWTPAFWYGAITVTMIFSVVAIHEYAHTWEGLRLGYDVENIHLIAIGGVAEFEDIPKGTWDEFRISIAGPIANLVLFLVTMIILPPGAFESLPETPVVTYPPWTPEFWAVFAVLNAVFFAFNLLPMFPTDGGRIFRSLLAKMVGVKKATKAAAALGCVGGGILIIFGATNLNLINVLVGGFLIFLAYAEYLSTVRDLD